jgi:insertion element IS1 protein InsB
MRVREAGPAYGSTAFTTHDHRHHGHQHHPCQAWGRQLVADAMDQIVSHAQHTLMAPRWRERLSRRGICRVVRVSRTRLLPCMVEGIAACPDPCDVRLPHRPTDVGRLRLPAEAEARWSVVPQQATRSWMWIAMDATTRQVMAFHLGDRRRDRAPALRAQIPGVSRDPARCPTG